MIKLDSKRNVAQFGRALRSGRRGRRFESCRLDHKRVTKKMPCEKLRFHRGFSRFRSKFFQYSFIDAKGQKTYSESIRTRKLNILAKPEIMFDAG